MKNPCIGAVAELSQTTTQALTQRVLQSQPESTEDIAGGAAKVQDYYLNVAKTYEPPRQPVTSDIYFFQEAFTGANPHRAQVFTAPFFDAARFFNVMIVEAFWADGA